MIHGANLKLLIEGVIAWIIPVKGFLKHNRDKGFAAPKFLYRSGNQSEVIVNFKLDRFKSSSPIRPFVN